MGAIIGLSSHGSLKLTDKFLKTISRPWYEKKLKSYAEEGLKALMDATPVDTGRTRDSWGYDITKQGDVYTISWVNTNRAENNGTSGPPVVVLLYYGHITKTGYYVEGRDFITPAIRPVFDKIAENAWMELNKK